MDEIHIANAHTFNVQEELKCGCYLCGLYTAGCPSAVDVTIFIRAAWFCIGRCIPNLLWCRGLLVMLHDHQFICWVPYSEGKRRGHLQEPCYSGTQFSTLLTRLLPTFAPPSPFLHSLLRKFEPFICSKVIIKKACSWFRSIKRQIYSCGAYTEDFTRLCCWIR